MEPQAKKRECVDTKALLTTLADSGDANARVVVAESLGRLGPAVDEGVAQVVTPS